MPHYFQYIPNVDYDIGVYKGPNPSSNTYNSATANEKGRADLKQIVPDSVNITRRFGLEQVIEGRKASFYNYTVQEGERPDMIAHRYYEDATLDWIIWLTNDIHDPYFQWPMDTYTFELYIRSKYGSLAEAKANVYAYYQILTQQKTLENGNVVSEKLIEVDQTTYNGLSSDWRKSLDNYEWEDQENEKRRNIVILERDFVPEVLKRCSRLVFNG